MRRFGPDSPERYASYRKGTRGASAPRSRPRHQEHCPRAVDLDNGGERAAEVGPAKARRYQQSRGGANPLHRRARPRFSCGQENRGFAARSLAAFAACLCLDWSDYGSRDRNHHRPDGCSRNRIGKCACAEGRSHNSGTRRGHCTGAVHAFSNLRSVDGRRQLLLRSEVEGDLSGLRLHGAIVAGQAHVHGSLHDRARPQLRNLVQPPVLYELQEREWRSGAAAPAFVQHQGPLSGFSEAAAPPMRPVWQRFAQISCLSAAGWRRVGHGHRR